ncbi:MAG: PadR family transcriptional regulator [Ignavibacteria bacterium]|nr:PadR family transcriptional regulator [Ignavibacteria bacterium]
MSLPHVILGFLHYAPASGYELKKTFDATVRHFWPADQSQIYRTLAQLVDDGHAETEEIVQSGKPNKKVYSITPAGEKELRGWLRAAPDAAASRNPALVRLFFLGNLGNDAILPMLDAAEERLRAELQTYASVPDLVREHAAFSVTKRERFFWMLTLEYGLAVTRAELDWIASIKKRLKKKSYTNVFATPRRRRVLK